MGLEMTDSEKDSHLICESCELSFLSIAKAA
jgi:hypothetical protein